VVFCTSTEQRLVYLQSPLHLLGGVSNIRDVIFNKQVSTKTAHGFRKGHSCETQLLLTTHDILKHRDDGKQIDVTVLDFSKASDTVPICRLLGKLEFYGINVPTLKWIESFLTGRTQSVLCDGVCSDSEKVLSGVAQGTVLAPLTLLATY